VGCICIFVLARHVFRTSFGALRRGVTGRYREWFIVLFSLYYEKECFIVFEARWLLSCHCKLLARVKRDTLQHAPCPLDDHLILVHTARPLDVTVRVLIRYGTTDKRPPLSPSFQPRFILFACPVSSGIICDTIQPILIDYSYSATAHTSRRPHTTHRTQLAIPATDTNTTFGNNIQRDVRSFEQGTYTLQPIVLSHCSSTPYLSP
jgi:hypothetical protein